jgi:hypothetical protein
MGWRRNSEWVFDVSFPWSPLLRNFCREKRKAFRSLCSWNFLSETPEWGHSPCNSLILCYTPHIPFLWRDSASCFLGRCSTARTIPPAFFAQNGMDHDPHIWCFLQKLGWQAFTTMPRFFSLIWGLWAFCLVWLRNTILQISTNYVARMTSVLKHV